MCTFSMHGFVNYVSKGPRFKIGPFFMMCRSGQIEYLQIHNCLVRISCAVVIIRVNSSLKNQKLSADDEVNLL